LGASNGTSASCTSRTPAGRCWIRGCSQLEKRAGTTLRETTCELREVEREMPKLYVLSLGSDPELLEPEAIARSLPL